jgi:peroxiredoxin
MESLFLIRKGDVSPSFTYMDIKKKEVSLSDFKGKLIYMDVWAT